MLSRSDVRQVACSFCGAQKDFPCKNYRNKARASNHQERVNLARLKEQNNFNNFIDKYWVPLNKKDG